MTHRTPAPIALLDAARPGLVQLRERIRATLSPEACAQVDAHVTQAQRLLEDVFAGLPVWMLQDSDELWARAADVAALMEVDRSVVIHRTASSITRREFSEGDIRRGVTDNDVSTSIVHHVHSHPSDADCLTTSPRGVTMLNLRAIRRLVMTCDGERGVRFRNGLDRAIEFADQAERVILELLLAEREQPRGARAAPATGDELAIEAHQTIRALIATGRKTIPSALMQQALGAPAPIRAPTPTSDNPTRRFLDECTRPDHNSAVLLALLYERYAQWARASSVPPLTRRRFSAELTRSDLPSFRGAGNRTFKRGLKLL